MVATPFMNWNRLHQFIAYHCALPIIIVSNQKHAFLTSLFVDFATLKVGGYSPTIIRQCLMRTNTDRNSWKVMEPIDFTKAFRVCKEKELLRSLSVFKVVSLWKFNGPSPDAYIQRGSPLTADIRGLRRISMNIVGICHH